MIQTITGRNSLTQPKDKAKVNVDDVAIFIDHDVAIVSTSKSIDIDKN